VTNRRLFTGHEFEVYPRPVVWAFYDTSLRQQSQERRDYDIVEAERQQVLFGRVGGGIMSANGQLQLVYTEPLGFPQSWHWSTSQPDYGSSYLVDFELLEQLPIAPSSISNQLLLIRVRLPQEDISASWMVGPPFPVMESVGLTEEQKGELDRLVKPGGGKVSGSSLSPFIVVAWEQRLAIMVSLKTLAPVR
jgi:hypothetical protein